MGLYNSIKKVRNTCYVSKSRNHWTNHGLWFKHGIDENSIFEIEDEITNFLYWKSKKQQARYVEPRIKPIIYSNAFLTVYSKGTVYANRNNKQVYLMRLHIKVYFYLSRKVALLGVVIKRVFYWLEAYCSLKFLCSWLGFIFSS